MDGQDGMSYNRWVEERDERRRNPPTKWGGWTFDPKTSVLEHDEPWYEVRVSEMTTCAETLDWIMQVGTKTWATDATIANLVRAIKAILHPQANMCSMGQEKGPIDVAAILAAEGYGPG